MDIKKYLMESEGEILRLELKTNRSKLKRQAVWAGIQQGMRIADIGCGTGKTTNYLYNLVKPHGSAVGVDISKERIQYARNHYSNKFKQIEFMKADIREPLTHLGLFDFVWVRFLLEYFRSTSFDIVKNVSNILKPGGILCLIDLDYNCLSHFGLPDKTERTINNIIHSLEKNADFDPYVGRKLYSFLYDLGYRNLDVKLAAHHLIFGRLNDIDLYNWTQKAKMVEKEFIY
jgi:ubiquinone/menaquinone biosynthesis C-methylase UbiE